MTAEGREDFLEEVMDKIELAQGRIGGKHVSRKSMCPGLGARIGVTVWLHSTLPLAF